MIILQNIGKTYYGKEIENEVLVHINMEVRENEFLMLYGESGSGKTTLLNIIGLIDRATTGKYFLQEKEISGLQEKQLAGIRNGMFGYIFQSFYLVPELNVIENVSLPAGYAGQKKKRALERADFLIEDVGLGKRKYHMPEQLSGGEKQRVAIARALMNDPEIILADEPTGNLDSQNSQNIMELLKRKHQEGKTIIMITHDRMLKKYATRVVQLMDGKICEE